MLTIDGIGENASPELELDEKDAKGLTGHSEEDDEEK